MPTIEYVKGIDLSLADLEAVIRDTAYYYRDTKLSAINSHAADEGHQP